MLLVGCLDSPFVRRVAVTLNHYGLRFERRPLLTFGQFEEVLKTNPLGKIPALVLDDGQLLIDSSCILDYFDRQVGPQLALTPPAGAARTHVQQIVAVALGLAEKSVEYRTETVRRPDEKMYPVAITRIARQIDSALTWLQACVDRASKDHLLLERLTQADLTTAIAVTNLRNKNPEFIAAARFEALLQWTQRCESLSSFRAAPFMEG